MNKFSCIWWLYPLFSTGSAQEDKKLSWHDWKIVDWDVKHQNRQIILFVMHLDDNNSLFHAFDSFSSDVSLKNIAKLVVAWL